MQYRVPREILQEIQARTSLVEVIGRYVSLQKRGRSYLGLCPFHGEKSPSFHVDESKRMFYCFGCQVGGDVFKFLTLIENEGFMDVVRDLASRCGVQLPEREISPEEKRQYDEREILLALLEVATGYYERNLMGGSLAARPMAYLEKRGLGEEMIREYRLGYAPDGWQNLANHVTSYLLQRKLNPALAAKAGLVVTKEDGGFYDRFRDRVIFPIRNVNSKVIAFGGRIMDKGEPKYLNSPETPLFNKSNALYGIDAARRAIGQDDCVVVVEGYFDVLAMHAAGIRNVVATCGTSLTKGHLQLLRRYTRNVLVMYDGDKAGQAAAERSLSLFLDEDMWPSYIMLPDGQDPDDVVRAEGGDAFRQRIKRAIPLLDHLIRRYGAESLKSPEERDKALEAVSPLLARLKPEKADLYSNLVAQHFGMDFHVASDFMRRVQQQGVPHRGLEAPRTLQAPVRKASIVLPSHEEFLVHWIVQRPEEILPAAIEAHITEWLTHEGLRRVVEWSIERFQAGEPVEIAQLLEVAQEPELQNKISALCLTELEISEQDREKALLQSLLGIKEKNIQYLSRHLSKEIEQAQAAGNRGELVRLVQLHAEVKREQAQIQRRRSGRAG